MLQLSLNQSWPTRAALGEITLSTIFKMSEIPKNQYQEHGYQTDIFSVGALMPCAKTQFSGNYEQALKFALTGVEDQRDITALKEACRWLSDHAKAAEQ